MVKHAPKPDAGFLATYDWLPVTSEEKMQQMLPGIVRKFARNNEESPDHGDARPELISPSFRNREDEVESVGRGLTNAAGPRLWLVSAAPQLGKTWFMDHLAAKILGEEVKGAARRVDVREYPEETRNDGAALLMDLFGLSRPAEIDPNGMRAIVRTVLGRRRRHLCLLDSAELLDENTAGKLRSCLSEIYRQVRGASINDVRLGLIVATRQHHTRR